MANLMSDLNISNLIKLLHAGESEILEYKSSFNDEALETVGAFANAKGGTLLLGVKDNGEVCGVQLGKKSLEDIANRIQEGSDPRLQPSISSISYENKNIVVISLSVTTRIPISIRGRYFRRTGKSNQRMSHEEIMQRMISGAGLSWDAIPESGATLNDLDSETINHFVETVKKNGRLPIPAHSSDQDVIRKLELIRDETPTRAALLLFGKNPESFFSSAFIKIGRFRTPTHIVDDREIHGNLIQQLEETMAWFKERLQTEYVITGEPAREVRWEYPLEAIREAITNSICHRDYTSLAHNQVRLYDDRLEIWNAGGLPSALTPEALFYEHDSMPRNRKIAESFFYAGFIERWGSGTLRIAEELLLAKLPAPQFTSDSGRFRVSFYKDYLADAIQEEMGLTSRQVKVIHYVKEYGSISNSICQEIAEVSERTAARDLNELKLKGILVSEGTAGRGTLYKLKPPQTRQSRHKPAINPPKAP